jgi:hypothetical protein
MHPVLLGQRCVCLADECLDVGSRLHGIEDAAELGNDAVTSRVGDAAAMTGDDIIGDGTVCRQRS